LLKKHWGTLTWPPQFDMTVQVQVPPGLAVIHNFTMDVDPRNIDNYLGGNADDLDPNPGQQQENDFGTLAGGAVSRAEKNRAMVNRDNIAQAMWEDYQWVRGE
ncbi:hypothetical protein HYPSUDRAFT_134136, partial [Hypholoma sublateritium FD-334 SS-4]